MTEPCHAVLAVFESNPAQRELQDEGLVRGIVPSVRAARGFVRGDWSTVEDGSERVAFVVFESKSDADSFCRQVRANRSDQSAVGLELISIRTLRVDVSA